MKFALGIAALLSLLTGCSIGRQEQSQAPTPIIDVAPFERAVMPKLERMESVVKTSADTSQQSANVAGAQIAKLEAELRVGLEANAVKIDKLSQKINVDTRIAIDPTLTADIAALRAEFRDVQVSVGKLLDVTVKGIETAQAHGTAIAGLVESVDNSTKEFKAGRDQTNYMVQLDQRTQEVLNQSNRTQFWIVVIGGVVVLGLVYMLGHHKGQVVLMERRMREKGML